MSFLGRLLLGKGKLRPELREALEAEGLVLLEEGIGGSLRYNHFKAPGKRFHGKVVPQRMTIGISKRRVVIYGQAKLLDVAFDEPRAQALDISLIAENKLAIVIDYDRLDTSGKVSGEITIRAKTPNAAAIVEQLQARFARAASNTP